MAMGAIFRTLGYYRGGSTTISPSAVLDLLQARIPRGRDILNRFSHVLSLARFNFCLENPW